MDMVSLTRNGIQCLLSVQCDFVLSILPTLFSYWKIQVFSTVSDP